MQLSNTSIIHFFEDHLKDLKCQPDTKSYIIGIYGKYKSSEFDFSKDSVTLIYAKAKENQDFITYQNLGDWILFTKTLNPNHLNYASEDYYNTIARISYYSCYKLINKQWKLFEQLSDEFIPLVNQIKIKLNFLHESKTVRIF